MTNTRRPDLTVVIPAYRAETFIARAIRSVLDQPGVDAEIIVVVDGIFDKSAEIAAAFPATRVLVNQTNQGAPAARNRGLAEARAPHVMFLDADDWVEGEFLLDLLERLTVEDADVAFGPLAVVGSDGQRMKTRCLSRSVAVNGYLASLIDGLFVPPCATMWRTAFLRANGGWKEGLRRYQDYELVVRSLIQGAQPTVGDRGLGIWFQHTSPHRISADMTAETCLDRLCVIRDLVDLAKEHGRFSGEVPQAFEGAAYKVVRSFARYANDAAYAEAKALWHELGGKRHHGSPVHRGSASILGLRRKERLSMALARLRARVLGQRVLGPPTVQHIGLRP